MKSKSAAAILVLLCLLQVACSRLTAENYAKIKMGMTYPEITNLLGKPDHCNDLAGFKSCQWGNDQRGITIRFLQETVVLYSAQNIQ